MTEDAQRIAIAKACGWTNIRMHREESVQLEWLVGSMPDPNPIFAVAIPDYTRDLNAMHEAEKKLSRAVLEGVYFLKIYNISKGYAFTATAAQKAEVFLKAIGKWEEE